MELALGEAGPQRDSLAVEAAKRPTQRFARSHLFISQAALESRIKDHVTNKQRAQDDKANSAVIKRYYASLGKVWG